MASHLNWYLEIALSIRIIRLPHCSIFELAHLYSSMQTNDPYVHYNNRSDECLSNSAEYVERIMSKTPLPKGRDAFSSIHVVAPPLSVKSEIAERTIKTIEKGSLELNREMHLHRLNEVGCKPVTTAMEEYNTIFEVASSLLMAKADRASLLIFVGWENVAMDAYAAFIAMLPFRGIQCAIITRRESYRNMLHYSTRSGTFVFDGLTAARMGKFSVHSIFGPLPSKSFSNGVNEWCPVDVSSALEEEGVTLLPFKIGGLNLPMLTHSGSCEEALYCLSELLKDRFPDGYTPIVSCGETCDALGYGQDLLDALDQDEGLLFAHRSGETYKRYDIYGDERLFATINKAKKSGSPPVIIAVGGGVNGNCIGLIAGLTNCEFIEVPTTPMHYNDAVTSAKKAFSLVVDDRILSKNILGCFYLPQLAFSVNEWFLTISSANVHAAVGEATKTMNMLGIANSIVGATDFHNILGGVEFASDFTKILTEVDGFDNLVNFIEDKNIIKKKKAIITIGKKIAAIRDARREEARKQVEEPAKMRKFSSQGKLMSMTSMASFVTVSTVQSAGDQSVMDSSVSDVTSPSISGYGSELSLSDDEDNVVSYFSLSIHVLLTDSSS